MSDTPREWSINENINNIVEWESHWCDENENEDGYIHVIEFGAYQKQSSQIAGLVEALEFYANPENWIERHTVTWHHIDPRNTSDGEQILNYHHPGTDWVGTVYVGGKKARAVLEQFRDAKPEVKE